MALNIGSQTQLLNAQLRITALGIAHDEQTVLLAQFGNGFLYPGIAEITFLSKEIVIFCLHAPVHDLVTLRAGNGLKNGIGDVSHNLAEEGEQIICGDEQVGKTLPLQLDVVTLRNLGTGIPEGSVDVKNQTFVFHISSKCR